MVAALLQNKNGFLEMERGYRKFIASALYLVRKQTYNK